MGVTKAMFRLIKSFAGAAAVCMLTAIFVLAVDQVPAAAQGVCGQAGTGAPLGLALLNGVACGGEATGAGSTGDWYQ